MFDQLVQYIDLHKKIRSP